MAKKSRCGERQVEVPEWDEEEWSQDSGTAHLNYRKDALSPEGAGAMSDDQGFHSAADIESEDVEMIEDEEDQHCRDKEEKIKENFERFFKKYCNPDLLAPGYDPFSVDYDEMVLVLRIGASECGLIKLVQLLDCSLKIFYDRVTKVWKAVIASVEELNENRRQKKTGQEESSSNQQHSGESQNSQEQRSGNAAALEETRRNFRHTSKNSHKQIVKNEEQLLNDFMNEKIGHIVARRENLHNGMRDAIQEPYLDFQFDFCELYSTGNEFENDEENLEHAVKLDDIRKFTQHSQMKSLPLPSFENVEHDMPDEDCGENLDDGSGIVDMDLGNNENVEPAPVMQENLPVEQEIDENLADVLMQMGLNGEGGLIVQQHKDKKKKCRKRRLPLFEQQNIAGNLTDGTAFDENKRLRLEAEEVANLSTEQQERERLQCEQNVHDEHLNCSGNIGGGQVFSNGQLTASFDNDYDPDGGGDNHEDFTAAQEEGSFQPPCLLSTQESSPSTLNFQSSNVRVNMQRVKTKFKDIVEAVRDQHEISFVEILQNSEMDVLVGPNETIHSFSNSLHQKSSSSTEISIGVALLAMLHNASQDKFYLKEDADVGFRVSHEKPVDPVPTHFL